MVEGTLVENSDNIWLFEMYPDLGNGVFVYGQFLMAAMILLHFQSIAKRCRLFLMKLALLLAEIARVWNNGNTQLCNGSKLQPLELTIPCSRIQNSTLGLSKPFQFIKEKSNI